ncbi:intradiol ring-cleavage dioxygenase [Streptomyces cacaoi]|uniref:intradiol ring-cleavage dioxygenase n=1 Tax=Streptomyces cacaoi TaxID=1898 RepID=UPI00374830B7
MTSDLTETTITEAVLSSFDGTPDPRLRDILRILVRHLHAFVRDVEPTHEEWQNAVDFLTNVGHMCHGNRQEFVLLSDTLGVSMLVDAINNRKPSKATESTVLGPFHVSGAPRRPLGADIALDGAGEQCVVSGVVRSVDGTPVSGAVIDVWQANADGTYDVQTPDLLPESNLRGVFTADSDGRYWFRTIVPRYYPIPDDGPVGQMLRSTGRHPNRPAHIHFIAGGEGLATLTTHLFINQSPYIDSDAVFAVKQSLIREVVTVDAQELASTYGVPNPFRLIDFDITLSPTGSCPV